MGKCSTRREFGLLERAKYQNISSSWSLEQSLSFIKMHSITFVLQFLYTMEGKKEKSNDNVGLWGTGKMQLWSEQAGKGKRYCFGVLSCWFACIPKQMTSSLNNDAIENDLFLRTDFLLNLVLESEKGSLYPLTPTQAMCYLTLI